MIDYKVIDHTDSKKVRELWSAIISSFTVDELLEEFEKQIEHKTKISGVTGFAARYRAQNELALVVVKDEIRRRIIVDFTLWSMDNLLDELTILAATREYHEKQHGRNTTLYLRVAEKIDAVKREIKKRAGDG